MAKPSLIAAGGRLVVRGTFAKQRRTKADTIQIHLSHRSAHTVTAATATLPPLALLPMPMLVRSAGLLSVMASPMLRRPALAILGRAVSNKGFLMNPNKNPVMRYLLTKTLYDQFCAGRTTEEIQRTMTTLRKMGYSGIILGNGRDVVLPIGETQTSAIKQYKQLDYDNVETWKVKTLATLRYLGAGDYLALK